MVGKRILSLIFLCFFANLQADPWGKDADLCQHPIETLPSSTRRPTPILGEISECLIGFHQNIISPADGPRSHFIPSSSQYTLDAIRAYGFFTGFALGCDRLMRENSDPWVYKVIYGPAGCMKWDPLK